MRLHTSKSQTWALSPFHSFLKELTSQLTYYSEELATSKYKLHHHVVNVYTILTKQIKYLLNLFLNNYQLLKAIAYVKQFRKTQVRCYILQKCSNTVQTVNGEREIKIGNQKLSYQIQSEVHISFPTMVLYDSSSQHEVIFKPATDPFETSL